MGRSTGAAGVDLKWQWAPERRDAGSGGDPQEWAVNAGIDVLAREACQNSRDAAVPNPDGFSAGVPHIDFTVIRLRGAQLGEFRNAIEWGALTTSLGAMDQPGLTVGQRIARAAQELSESDSLTLLRIDDFGCEGLTGPDLADDAEGADSYGNFLKLCRFDLFSQKHAGRGGSYGLGKSVYWRSSSIKTVLFNSQLRAEDAIYGQNRNRFIGVNQGAGHPSAGRRRIGRGYFGRSVEHDHDEYIISSWIGDDLARALHLERPTAAPGTSIVIVGFSDINHPDLGPDQLADQLRRGIAASFWPAIVRGSLEATVGVDDGDGREAQRVDPDRYEFSELPALLRKFDAGDLADDLEIPGSVIARDVTVRVPKRKSEPRHESFEHRAHLLVTRSDANSDEYQNTFCLIRGAEMVVESVEYAVGETSYHAVVLAGRATSPRGLTERDGLADDFLRFAEPPSHDTWFERRGKPQLNLATHYQAPFRPQLDAFENEIKRVLRELLAPGEDEPEPIPRALLHRDFNLLQSGATTGEHAVTSEIENIEVDADGAARMRFKLRVPVRKSVARYVVAAAMVGAAGAPKALRWRELSMEKAPARKDLDLVGEVLTVGGSTVVREGGPSTRLTVTIFGVTDPGSHPVDVRDAALDVRCKEARETSS